MKIFIILPRVPYPLEKGDKLRAFHQIKSLSKNNEIILFAINDTTIHKDALSVLNKYCSAIHVFNISKFSIFINLIKAFFTGKPFQVGYFYNNQAQQMVDSLIEKYKPDHIFCQLLRVSEYVKNQPVPKTLDYMDAFSKGVERRYLNARFYEKLAFKIEFERLLKYERDIFSFFDNKTIISYQDRDLIHHPEFDQIRVIPNGVDTAFFKPLDLAKKYDLVFTGNMNYPPNIDAAEFLVLNIVPLLLRKYPYLRVLLAGASPSPRVLALSSGHVTVSGWVDDIRNCYAEARIFIAPMQLGIGLQNKLLEAMAMQIPCITSALANNALKAEENTEILVGKTPENYAVHISTLLENTDKAHSMALKGKEFVLRNYNWQTNNAVLEQIMLNTCP